jgi:hypothetical protein
LATNVPSILAGIAALLGILVLLNTPLRDPVLPHEDISPVFTSPTINLRTPEDNLTPWQYMSVSWMAPLISKGMTRKVDDEDVWDLGWEYKHARLHTAFRTLQGTVTKRLLVANGMDLVRTATLALIQLVASKYFALIAHQNKTSLQIVSALELTPLALSTPILLQQLLASMKDPNSTHQATITYASLSLLVRLISAQCGVFNLWYQRRSYERSRGEMITMLYEKTLNRKVMGAKQDSTDEQPKAHVDTETNDHANDDANGALQLSKSSPSYVRNALRMGWLYIRSSFQRGSKVEKKEDGPASMGKILNLMR